MVCLGKGYDMCQTSNLLCMSDDTQIHIHVMSGIGRKKPKNKPEYQYNTKVTPP